MQSSNTMHQSTMANGGVGRAVPGVDGCMGWSLEEKVDAYWCCNNWQFGVMVALMVMVMMTIMMQHAKVDGIVRLVAWVDHYSSPRELNGLLSSVPQSMSC
mmetsp:Transcript_38036/g.79680  ORF Transcript_38036/g.79680 Transcript_38036/m.79680 type:complete len:101 (-) Transcript_38036:563-865(-)